MLHRELRQRTRAQGQGRHAAQEQGNVRGGSGNHGFTLCPVKIDVPARTCSLDRHQLGAPRKITRHPGVSVSQIERCAENRHVPVQRSRRTWLTFAGAISCDRGFCNLLAPIFDDGRRQLGQFQVGKLLVAQHQIRQTVLGILRGLFAFRALQVLNIVFTGITNGLGSDYAALVGVLLALHRHLHGLVKPLMIRVLVQRPQTLLAVLAGFPVRHAYPPCPGGL